MKDTICSYHEDIKLLAKKIKKLTTDKQLQEYATQIYNITKLATKAGQHMENRLQLYKEAIEGLGFVRKKGKRK